MREGCTAVPVNSRCKPTNHLRSHSIVTWSNTDCSLKLRLGQGEVNAAEVQMTYGVAEHSIPIHRKMKIESEKSRCLGRRLISGDGSPIDLKQFHANNVNCFDARSLVRRRRSDQ